MLILAQIKYRLGSVFGVYIDSLLRIYDWYCHLGISFNSTNL